MILRGRLFSLGKAFRAGDACTRDGAGTGPTWRQWLEARAGISRRQVLEVHAPPGEFRVSRLVVDRHYPFENPDFMIGQKVDHFRRRYSRGSQALNRICRGPTTPY